MVDRKWSATCCAVAALGDKVMFLDATDCTNKMEAISTVLDLQNAETKTLTNKTIALGSNTVSGTAAEFNTAMTDDTIAGSATTNTFTNKTLDANGTGNSLSNVDVADLANGTDGE